jgi:hypothetical protein
MLFQLDGLNFRLHFSILLLGTFVIAPLLGAPARRRNGVFGQTFPVEEEAKPTLREFHLRVD